jgi:hypothetical protein
MTAAIDHTFAPTTMPDAHHAATPWPAVLTVAAGAIFLDGAVLTAAYRNSSPVSEDAFAFPWQGSTAVATSLLWGLAQALMVVGLVAFARSDAPAGRTGQIGARLAIGGGVSFTLAHLVSALAYDASTDDAGAIVAMSLFGIGTIALAVGLLLAGRASLPNPNRSTWVQRAPLALGIWMVLMIPLQFTSALAVAVGGYAVLVIAFGAALLDHRPATDPR